MLDLAPRREAFDEGSPLPLTGLWAAAAPSPTLVEGGDAPQTLIRYERPYLYPKQEDALFTPERYAVIEAST